MNISLGDGEEVCSLFHFVSPPKAFYNNQMQMIFLIGVSYQFKLIHKEIYQNQAKEESLFSLISKGFPIYPLFDI